MTMEAEAVDENRSSTANPATFALERAISSSSFLEMAKTALSKNAPSTSLHAMLSRTHLKDPQNASSSMDEMQPLCFPSIGWSFHDDEEEEEFDFSAKSMDAVEALSNALNFLQDEESHDEHRSSKRCRVETQVGGGMRRSKALKNKLSSLSCSLSEIRDTSRTAKGSLLCV